jgi:hypothetical protein
MTTTTRTSWAVTLLAGAAAALGLLLPNVYPDRAGTEAMLRGYDLVIIIVVVPALTAALIAQRRSRLGVLADLLELSLLAYLVYTYAYYILGTSYTTLMLLHLAVFSTALVALVLAAARLDSTAIGTALGPRTHVRPVAAVLMALTVGLGAMWIYYSVHSAVTGQVPPGSELVESATVVHLGIVLDLALLVPLYGVAAVLLWRRAAWGYVLGVVALVSGLLLQISYVVALLAQYAADVPGSVAWDPVEPVIILLYGAATVVLLVGLPRRVDETDQPSIPTAPDAPRATGTDEGSRRNHADAR